MQFECPSCHATRSVNPRLLGRVIRCPECGQQVRLPTAEEAEEQERQRQRRIKQKAERAARARAASAAPVVEAVDITTPDAVTSAADEIAEEEKQLEAALTSFTRPRPTRSQEMDMTPMVDVTFLLLIFFMITASFSVQKSIQRPAQRKEDPSLNAVEMQDEENPDIVTVQVDEFNAYNIITTDWDRAVVSKQDLIVALSEAHDGGVGGQQPTKLVVQAHEDSIHRAVVDALDAGREALFESFEVSTVEQFD